MNGLSYFTTSLVLIAYLFLNLDGYQIHLAARLGSPPHWYGPGDFTGEPPWRNWAHGWPIAFGTRLCVDRVKGTRFVTSRWPFDGVPFTSFDPAIAVLDLVIGLILISGTFIGTNLVSRCFGLRAQFSISAMLASIALAAVAIAFREQLFASRYTLEIIAAITIAMGLCLCIVSLFACGIAVIRRRPAAVGRA